VKRSVFRGHLDIPKGGREREVPLNDRALQALREEVPRAPGAKWLFPQRDSGFIRNPQHSCAEAILRNAQRAGLRPIGWHTLRHTFASHLVMRGVPLKVVQELLGHATMDMTVRGHDGEVRPPRARHPQRRREAPRRTPEGHIRGT
jgi:integrase